jgi:hypothetical protein
MLRRSLVVVALAAAVLLLLDSTGLAERARSPTRPNLPPGWTWPPSRETRREGRRCMRDLRKLGVKFKPTYRKPPFVMDCRLARAFATYGNLIGTLGIREVRFSSIYDYRRVRLRHRVHRALSRHALGLAVDIFEVVLASGQKVDVDKDYWSSPALIVAELALRSSGGFRAILSPAVDPVSHADHLHIEVKVEQPESAKKKKKKRRNRRTRLSQLPG